MRIFILGLLCLLTTAHINYAQVDQLWSESEPVLKSTNGRWNGVHRNQKALNRNALDAVLMKINTSGTSQISIPHPSGDEMEFTIKPSNLLAKGLQEKYPEIKTFKGYNHKTGDQIRINVNSRGMHAIVYSNNGNIYLDPQSDGSNNYVSYFQADYKAANNLQKEFIEKHLMDEPHEGHLLKSASVQNKFKKRSLGTHLRKYRIAISTSRNYTSYHGGKTKALEAVVNTLDRITGVFEIDAAITFELVEGNDQLIFTSSNNPFSSITISSALREKNVEVLKDIIGNENYDIGHLFTASGGGGEARVGQVCNDKGKGHGITQIRNPIGDAFDIEYVAHEVGHQLGALHSFGGVCSASLNSGSQFTQQSAYELGSGTSIMSYAGLCGYNNIVSRSKDYFHAISIEEFQSLINRTSCETLVETGNTPPTVSIRQGGFVIPINTPFVLEAEGSDVDSDVLTYSWEQFDRAKKEENLADKPLSNGFDSIMTAEEIEDYYTNEHDWSQMIAFWESQNMTQDQIDSAITKNIEDQVLYTQVLQDKYLEQKWEGDGPLFRSYPPTNDNKRYFPRLKDVVKGKSTIFEVMPFKTRELNFVITVKDNKAGLTNDLLTFSSTDQAGPFLVTSTFSESPYTGYSAYNVEWDVANTDIAPVNCSKVDILFSDNGGESFDYVLLENTDNDGSENVQLPNIATTKGRIMVKASENVFFNVNEANFQINSIEVDIPDAPINLTGSQIGVSKVQLNWDDNSTVENGFIIERKMEGDVNFEKIGETGFDMTTFSDVHFNNSKTYTYRVAAQNEKGVSDYSNSVTLSLSSTDITFIENEVIYPNPTSGFINLPYSWSQHAKSIIIYNMQGKQLMEIDNNSSLEKIDVSELQNGLYFMKICTEHMDITRKFCKE